MANTIFSRLTAGLVLVYNLVGCTGELQRFVDEDRPLSLSFVSSTAATPTYSLQNRTVSFSVTFRMDRGGKYTLLHGSSCDTGKAPSGVTQSATMIAHTDMTVGLSVSLDDVITYGNSLVVCASDVADYRKSELTISFQNALDYLAQQNESTGSGLPLDSGLTAEFAVFQNNWTSGSPNRGGATSANGVNAPRQFAAFVDPNDSYKIKYFVVDMSNHRVLVFHTRPDAWGSTAAVVIGQNNFTDFNPNAGAGVDKIGFNLPTTIAVSAAGRLYVVDVGNHRVLGFDKIPTMSGQPADFVIGQPDFTSNAANNGSLSRAQWLNQPTTVSILGGKLYLVDSANHRILVFDTIPASDAPSASMAIGQPDLSTISSGADYTTGSSYLNRPVHVAFGNDRMYLSDNFNHRVLVFNNIPSVSDTRPDFVVGQISSSGSNANCSLVTNSNCLSDPRGLAVRNSRLAISDAGNNRVLFFNLPVTANLPAATDVLGQSSMFGNTPATSQTGLNQPTVIAMDNGYIWITEHNNHRIAVRQLP